jgi:predicted aspartyl protease
MKKLHRVVGTLAALLTASLAHAADDQQCRFVRIAELPLSYTGSGLQVTTEGTINHAPAIVLVDTGAYDSMLTRTATERLGLALNMTGRYAEGIGGYSRVYAARVTDFTFGAAKAAKGWFPVIGDTGDAPTFDAIAGAPFLLQADMEVDLPGKKMKFFRTLGNCAERSLAYWDPNAVEIPFEYHESTSPNPHFTVEVNGEKMEAIIDTGASLTVISSAAAKRAGLKLDGPGVVRLGDMHGIGDKHVAHWAATVARLVIGRETILDAEIGVMDSEPGSHVDMLLGDDFLRSHRLLFAMGQKKLYMSYQGGDPFKQRQSVEPWIVKEAEGGNAEAQLYLANIYASGRGVPRDLAKSNALVDQAAALGNPRANLQLGRRLMAQHHYPEAVSKMQEALARMPAERFGALSLYLARLHAGQADVAKRELEATFARGERDEWPAPLGDFYLGRIDAAAMLDAAGKDAKQSKARTCTAMSWIAPLYGAQGDKEKAEAAVESFRARCAPAAPAKQGS